MWLSWLLVVAQTQAPPSFEAEDPEGRAVELVASSLPLADPRTKGIWVIRPRGFAAPAAHARDGDETLPGLTPARVTLADGDQLAARVRGGEREELRLELTGGVVVPFALDELASLEFPAQVAGEGSTAFAPAAEGDRLYRRAAAIEPLDGTLLGFTDEGVRFESELGSKLIPWSEVAALFIESLERKTPEPGSSLVPVVVSFAGRGAGRVRATLLAFERDAVRLQLGRTEVRLPHHAVLELVVADGRLTYLSDLTPSSESGRGSPFGDELGMSWPHRLDRNVLGGELAVGGTVHARGIGQHAPSRLTFALDGTYRALRGRVGIDDSSLQNGGGARGSVVFRLHADGALVWESALVRGGDAPVALPALDLRGKRELVLEADPAGDFAGDRADWLEPLLVR